MITKQTLRKQYKALRASLDDAAIADQSLAIANQALKLPIWKYTNYHIFLPIEHKREVDTSYLLHVLQGKDKSIILSKSNFETHMMQHVFLQENTRIEISEFGVPEPQEGIEVSVSNIDVVFIPLLAFDKKGNRLGYGKGFYDRFLKECNPNTHFVGVSYFEAEDKMPNTQYDIPLHFCITPNKIYAF
jgi:5-formyltetrahydrofolate cyclo-ligase